MIKIKLLRTLLNLLLVGIFTFSCVPNRKIIYMQDLGVDSNPLNFSSENYPYEESVYLLQNHDIVDINIKTTSLELNAIFSAISGGEESNANMMMGQNGGDVFFMNGYTLDKEGMVEIPLIGKVKLVGLTPAEAQTEIASRVQKYVTDDDFFVRVRLGGIRFSALGEFKSPGKHTMLQNRVSIFEGLAAAGDMTTIANRNEVILLRQYPDGSRLHKIDLTDRNLLSSQFYFIRPNDVIYAEPLKAREIGSGNFIQTLALITSTISTIAIVITLARQN